MISFEYFKKENYNRLLEMLLAFFTSPALTDPLEEHIVINLLDDILEGKQNIDGIEIYYGDKLVGFGTLTSYYATEVAGKTVQFEDLYIEDVYRGKGIASEYFSRIMEKYPDAKRFRLEVEESNHRAIKLYERLDFAPICYLQMVNE
ncbi:GNAT family N-acetyltransferase [Helcococcus kunzii]|uniref:N-acetyltransferase domain-containing protein n=1 Tax=Helcococcus kunzii ATCC 51366 TaxID=883114 RepID=H3NLQ8_9FIRM|nr:GNAT family N-acetyltransferase [Helcococcus kunzii]EHR35715.1 hypothetical protein HMPREF9709_00269 [Helcococcus kunzii ATCC 51366]MCT1796274.1 GNAT family N-acetyltransferase [Helcococcus kunzii]MCT1989132.1 GNAT family N-acetyltransferase [Helcococcus kunzii]QUY64198.1 GNAT family N-acetyltransferase [Helcococcus kunzii]QZO76654.1 GNAT family N-acetyltransferase [Helcococcus kunzii]